MYSTVRDEGEGEYIAAICFIFWTVLLCADKMRVGSVSFLNRRTKKNCVDDRWHINISFILRDFKVHSNRNEPIEVGSAQ